MSAPLRLGWRLAFFALLMACAPTGKSPAFVPMPSTRVEVEVRDGRKGAFTTAELREVIGVGVPDTDVIALVVDIRSPLRLSTINHTILYLSDELKGELKLISPDTNGLIGYERTKTVNVYRGQVLGLGGYSFGGALLDVLVGPRQQQVRARSMKPAVARLETQHVRNREVVSIPEDLPPGVYVLTDDYTYLAFEVVESSWKDVAYQERLRRTRDNPRGFGIRVDGSYARLEGNASAESSDDEPALGEAVPSSGVFSGSVARIAVVPSFRLPAWRLLTVELYAGPALLIAVGSPTSTPANAAGGMAFTLGARPEVPLVSFSRRYGMSFGLDFRFDAGLLSGGPYLISTGPEFTITPDLTFSLPGMAIGLGVGYQTVDNSALFRLTLRL